MNTGYPDPPRATCPVCRTPLDWSSIKPYIVLAEEAKYCPALSLAAAGKDIPPNTPSHRSASEVSDEKDAQQRFADAENVVRAFFPNGVARELLVSKVVDFSLPHGDAGCAHQLFDDKHFIDIFGLLPRLEMFNLF